MSNIDETKKELMEFGFNYADAENAAKFANGNLHEALYYLYNNMIKIQLKIKETQPINMNNYQNNYNRNISINNNNSYNNNISNTHSLNNFNNNSQNTNTSNSNTILSNNPYINNASSFNNSIANTNISNNNNNIINNNNNNSLTNSNNSSKSNTRYNYLPASINNIQTNNANLNSNQNQISTSNSKINQKPNDATLNSEDEEKMFEKAFSVSEISNKNQNVSASINKSNKPNNKSIREQISYTREENVIAFIKSIKEAYPPSINRYILIDCFKTLKVILQNIVNNPNDEKYCKIKTTNKVFMEKVSKINLAMNIIYEVGFHKEKENEVLVLKKEDQDFELFDTIIKIFEDELAALEA